MIELDHIQRSGHVLVAHTVEGHHVRADGGLGVLPQNIYMAVDERNIALIMELIPLQPDMGILPGPGGCLDLVKISISLAENIQIPLLVHFFDGAVFLFEIAVETIPAMIAVAVSPGVDLVIQLPADHIGIGSKFFGHSLHNGGTVALIIRVVGTAMAASAVL